MTASILYAQHATIRAAHAQAIRLIALNVLIPQFPTATLQFRPAHAI
jgi:hypothetical protein